MLTDLESESHNIQPENISARQSWLNRFSILALLPRHLLPCEVIWQSLIWRGNTAWHNTRSHQTAAEAGETRTKSWFNLDGSPVCAFRSISSDVAEEKTRARQDFIDLKSAERPRQPQTSPFSEHAPPSAGGGEEEKDDEEERGYSKPRPCGRF